jgi:hypothetical protein
MFVDLEVLQLLSLISGEWEIRAPPPREEFFSHQSESRERVDR